MPPVSARRDQVGAAAPCASTAPRPPTTASTGPMRRDHRAAPSSGSVALARRRASAPARRVSRLVPSASSWASRSARLDAEIAEHARPSRRCRWRCPSAESAARSGRVRSPTAPTPERGRAARAGRRERDSRGHRRRRPCRARRPAVAHLDPPRQRRGDLAVVGDHDDRRAGRVQLASSSMTPAPDGVSRLPVGSSASTIAGSPTSARAIADPLALAAGELRRAVVAARWPSPTRSSAAARPRAPLAPRRTPRVEQAVGDVVERRQRRRAGGTAGTRTRSGAPAAPDSRRSDSAATSCAVDAHRARRRAGRACR